MKFLKFKIHFLIFIFIIVLGGFFRLYRLEESPLGLYVDEAAIGYNAYSILNTGKDEYGKSFPLYFRSFGDYKMPVYIYLSTIPVNFLGLNILSIRLNSFIFGLLTVILIYFLTNLIFSQYDRLLGLLTSFLFALSPLPIFFSRMALEASTALFFLLFGLFLQIKAFKKKTFILLILSIFFYALSSYTYHTEKFLSLPIFFFSSLILCSEYRHHWKGCLKKIIIATVLLIVFYIPHIALFDSTAGQARINSLSILKDRQSNFVRNYLSLYTAYFSPRNIFFDSDPDPQRSLPELSVFYPWMIFPFFIGIYFLFMDKKIDFGKRIVMVFLFLSPIPASFAGDPFSSFRVYPFVFPLTLIMSIGIYRLYFLIKNKYLYVFIFLFITLLSLISFYRSNFILLPQERFSAWSFGYYLLAEKIRQYPKQKILIDDPVGISYIELLFFQKYDPRDLQKERRLLNLKDYYYLEEWSKESSWSRYSVRPLNWKQDVYFEQMIIATPIAISENQAKEHFFSKAFAIIGPDGKTIFNGYLTNPDLKRQDDERKIRLIKNESGNF